MHLRALGPDAAAAWRALQKSAAQDADAGVRKEAAKSLAKIETVVKYHSLFYVPYAQVWLSDKIFTYYEQYAKIHYVRLAFQWWNNGFRLKKINAIVHSLQYVLCSLLVNFR